MSAREEDLRMLRDALATNSLSDYEREAFEDMLENLEPIYCQLSEKQRAWLKRVLDLPDYQNLASKNGTRTPRAAKHNHLELAECGSACPAWTPPTLRDLPKRPPSRKVGP